MTKRMTKLILAILTLSFSVNTFAQTAPAALKRPPQFVMVSFDGSSSHNFWRETLALSEKANARFSYFISGVYFVKKANRNIYQPPHHKLGGSDIGFADNDPADIEGRTNFVWQALTKGFDIGSHVNGHYDGGAWTKEDWSSEFSQFHKFVEQVFSLNPDVRSSIANQWPAKLHESLRGFRAPLLAENKGTQEVMKDFGYLYDASQVSRAVWPSKMATGVWNLGLSQVQLAGTKHNTIAMDYNILYGQCNGKFNPRNSGECAEISAASLKYFEDQTYNTYIAAFLKNYYGNRAPISIGHHFSLWNKGIYWKALQRAVYDMCKQPEVQCITHKDMVAWAEEGLKANGASFLTRLTQGQFEKAGVPTTVAATLRIDLNFANKVADTGELIISEMSPATQRVMMKGDLPQAHASESNDEDMDAFRYQPDLTR